VESKTGRIRPVVKSMKIQIARNGEVLGEWTQTQLYSLLRANEVSPTDYYWHEGMTEWRRLVELSTCKRVLATPAQRQMLTDHGLAWDEFTTKYQASKLMDSRPCTEKQRLLMDDLGIVHFDGMTIKEASDQIDAERSGTNPDGPATAKQVAIIRALAKIAKVGPMISLSAPMRRDAACEIRALRCAVDISQRECRR
jgi:hypothetical protein